MHAMLQQAEPKDYIIGTGVSHRPSRFSSGDHGAMRELGPASNVPQIGGRMGGDQTPKFLRTGEIHDLRRGRELGAPELGWQPVVGFKQLVKMMLSRI